MDALLDCIAEDKCLLFFALYGYLFTFTVCVSADFFHCWRSEINLFNYKSKQNKWLLLENVREEPLYYKRQDEKQKGKEQFLKSAHEIFIATLQGEPRYSQRFITVFFVFFLSLARMRLVSAESLLERIKTEAQIPKLQIQTLRKVTDSVCWCRPVVCQLGYDLLRQKEKFSL